MRTVLLDTSALHEHRDRQDSAPRQPDCEEEWRLRLLLSRMIRTMMMMIIIIIRKDALLCIVDQRTIHPRDEFRWAAVSDDDDEDGGLWSPTVTGKRGRRQHKYDNNDYEEDTRIEAGNELRFFSLRLSVRVRVRVHSPPSTSQHCQNCPSSTNQPTTTESTRKTISRNATTSDPRKSFCALSSPFTGPSIILGYGRWLGIQWIKINVLF